MPFPRTKCRNMPSSAAYLSVDVDALPLHQQLDDGQVVLRHGPVQRLALVQVAPRVELRVGLRVCIDGVSSVQLA